jgi:hypothetical protein
MTLLLRWFVVAELLDVKWGHFTIIRGIGKAGIRREI